MKFLDFVKDNVVCLDGGCGTYLQKNGLAGGELPERWNVSHPEVITGMHKAYYDAGSNVVNTNTFGANPLKFAEDELEQIVAAAKAAHAHSFIKRLPNGYVNFWFYLGISIKR